MYLKTLENLRRLQAKTEVEQSEVHHFQKEVKERTEVGSSYLHKIDHIEFIPMSNIDDAKEFKEAIVDNGIFTGEIGNIFENGGFDRTIRQLDHAIHNCQRLEQKSIGLILMFHHNLQEMNT